MHDPKDNRVLAIQAWLQRYEQLRYAPRHGRGSSSDLAALRRELKELSWPT